MYLQYEAMKRADADEIARWKYEEPYSFYDNDASEEAIREMLDPDNPYYAVFDSEHALVGCFCAGNSAQVPNESYVYAEPYLDIGLGMRPELTGRGLGSEFFAFVLGSLALIHGEVPLRLTVAAFNRRAVRLYRKHGFDEAGSFPKGATEFIVLLNQKHAGS
ncbi:GNAT family N-acetyltransferase [Paenibacillus sp. T1]|uniref:GNAT family N-acetyltransferase n=2 Tax=Paenibacillus glycinis TaxID=2697035 RepID=A0ABW9XZ52_9BACL|nr:GNAT family N-acetyltransferase [Paenibacillus glycinis]